MDYQDIQRTLEEYAATQSEIIAIYVFGSRSIGVETAKSDLDLAVLLHPKARESSIDLSVSFSRLFPETQVDVHVVSTNMSLPFFEEILRHGKIVVDKDPEQRYLFEDTMRKKILDFALIRKAHLNAFLDRMKEVKYGN